MLNLSEAKRFVVLGGGTAGWFAALELRNSLPADTEVLVVSAPDIPVIGVGEGGVLNFMDALHRLRIPFAEFVQATGAVHKLGFAYERWRTGQDDDVYYHMFPSLNPAKYLNQDGFHPVFSALHNHGIPISHLVDSIRLREQNVAQAELTRQFMAGTPGLNFTASFHFDAYQVGAYLRQVALQRGVRHLEGTLDTLQQDAQGLVTHLQVNGTRWDCDFVIDATGLSRRLIQQALNTRWQSMADRLVMNRAIPFHLPHPRPNPDLVTRATALSAGWIWQIPLQHRVGAGYVFCDAYLSEDQALQEIRQWHGPAVEPIRTIRFEAGYFTEVWRGNVMAIGLASGFVEPLEATSIGQTLSQLEVFARLMRQQRWVVSRQQVDYFNQQHRQAWEGIGDFIRMHYDTSRQDTPFWRATATLPQSDRYRELKQCWQVRTPRPQDFYGHEMDTNLQFGVYSWFAVGQAMGLIAPEATVPDLLALNAAQRQQLALQLAEVKNRYRL